MTDTKAPALRFPPKPVNPEKQKVRDALAAWLIRPTCPELTQALREALDNFELCFRLWQVIPKPTKAHPPPVDHSRRTQAPLT